MPSLEWNSEYDENDNTTYWASGCFTDECGSPEYAYRIRPVLEEDRIQWTTRGTDEELIPLNDQKNFNTLEEAQADCQRVDDEHLAQAEDI